MPLDFRLWISLVWSAICLYWIITSLRLKPVARIESFTTRLLQWSLLSVVVVLMFSQRPLPAFFEQQVVPRSTLAEVLGIAVAAAGAMIALEARRQLGGNWSASVTIKQGHELVRTGPYALVRHPIYFGLLISALGTAIAFGQVRDWIALPIWVAAFRIKQMTEERMLIEAFGDRYREYRQTVRSAMIPFLL
jgi:protein-S-isoprenylcysteine O-methyltransferase Ste14